GATFFIVGPHKKAKLGQPPRNGGWLTKFKGDQMRKLIYAINITLDGCCDHTKQSVDEEKLEYFTHLTREVSKIFKFFFIDRLFGVVAAAIQSNVDCVD